MKKGQSHMVDLIISVSVFMILLVIIYSAWFRTIDTTADEILQFRADEAAERATVSLTKSPGFPSNWAAKNISPSSSDLKGIGIASSYGVIDPTKLEILEYYFNNSAYYNSTKQKMGISPFNGDVRVSYLNGTNISVMGSPPVVSEMVLATHQRLAVYKNNTVIVRVRVWQS
ncbi:MAG: hypothetical protein ABIH83_04300 [Candidatus Micrarchaeota archaeon]